MMRKLWTQSWSILAIGAWLLGSLPACEDSRVYAAESSVVTVDVNKATDLELQDLAGVGPAIAKRIVEYRTQYGNFARADELQNVPGIGPRKFEKMKIQITI